MGIRTRTARLLSGDSHRKLLLDEHFLPVGHLSGVFVAMPLATAAETLDREFLEIRARILELAARFDRLERSEGNLTGDPRLSQIQQVLAELSSPGADRAERVQLVFSRTYDADWKRNLGVNR